MARARTAAERREAAEARRTRRASVSDPQVVMDAAAAFLAVRPRSVSETRQRLLRLGYPAALCESVVDRLVELGYLDDHAFATAWIDSRDRARPRGAVALRRELALKGVPAATIDAVLDARETAAGDGDEDVLACSRSSNADAAAARRLLERRAASLGRVADPRRRRQRAYALLAGRGFPPDVCAEVAATITENDDQDQGLV